ncbi:MAG: ribosomal protein [Patescibacteria group bacterium]|jgi:large subunit ribosomal protein L11|nr:ribosomal protein [Patescibacteria group bacterium]
MAVQKPIKTIIKLQCPAGKAQPAPPVGTALGPQGVNIMDFCKQFNDATRDKGDTVIPVEITVYEDRTFSFIMKQPPAAILIKQALGLKSGSSSVKKVKVGTLTKEMVAKIVEIKMPDLSARTPEEAAKIIAGTARSMGIDVEK